MLVRHAGGLVAFEVGDDSSLALSITKRDLIAAAAEALAPYPQYADYHVGDEWVLVRVKRVVRTKGGLSFTKDEVALAKWCEAEYGNGVEILGEGWTVWSPLRAGHVRLPDRYVEPVTAA